MNIDDSQEATLGNTGNMGNSANRNFGPQKYPEKMPNYSPSTSYNYGHHGGGYSNMQQHPRRRADRFKRESLNMNDKIVKQNDLIIRLLREIRDRLPPPAQDQQAAPASDVNQDYTNPSGQDAVQEPPASQQSEGQSDQANEFQ